jgi:hypothetical protein
MVRLGLSFRPCGKAYRGFWKNGKQHGEGEVFFVKANKWIKGLWNEGRKISRILITEAL